MQSFRSWCNERACQSLLLLHFPHFLLSNFLNVRPYSFRIFSNPWLYFSFLPKWMKRLLRDLLTHVLCQYKKKRLLAGLSIVVPASCYATFQTWSGKSHKYWEGFREKNSSLEIPNVHPTTCSKDARHNQSLMLR